MKKFTIIFIYILISSILFIPVQSFADDCTDTCKLQEGTPEILTQYINDIKVIQKNVLKMTQKKIDDQFSKNKITAKITKALNTLPSWDFDFSSFEYYITLPITQSVPPEIKRDLGIIEREVESLRKSLENTTKKGYVDTVVENPCDNLSVITKCNLDGKTTSEILSLLIDDMYILSGYYKKAIVGQGKIFENTSTFFPDSFFTDMGKYYNENTAEDCSRCEGNFTERAETAITAISEFNQQGKDGIKEWVDAWNLLIGNYDEVEYRNIERSILKKGLAQQGIGGDNASTILGNLDRFNEKGFFSEDNNYVTNSFNAIAKEVYEEANNFDEAILQNFEDLSNEKTIPISRLTATYEKSKTSVDLKKEIELLYNAELPLINEDNTEDLKFESRVISLHVNLIDAIDILDKLLEVSQKVCNDQVNGLGNCN